MEPKRKSKLLFGMEFLVNVRRRDKLGSSEVDIII